MQSIETLGQHSSRQMVSEQGPGELDGLKILMLAPCLGKFGGIETFCIALTEDLLKRGASVTLLRKKVSGFSPDGSIEKSEAEIRATWSRKMQARLETAYVERADSRVRKAFETCDLVHLHNPLAEGVWLAKRRRLPCVMTIYNWRRKGLHPRLWAWRWAAARADRRWYISEFVWDSWEKNRRSNSARLPVVSRMPSGEIPHKERKGFLFLGRWIPNKGIRVLLEAYRLLSPDPDAWPLTLCVPHLKAPPCLPGSHLIAAAD